MEMDELTREEEVALIGLLKAVIQADKQLSFEENEELKRVATQMGADRFHERVTEAKQLFKTLGDIKTYAQKVERPEARERIFAFVREMARQDGVIEPEEELLTWLAETWGVEYFRN
jgi:uncharacterized tellurite resistance protein B-like protein